MSIFKAVLKVGSAALPGALAAKASLESGNLVEGGIKFISTYAGLSSGTFNPAEAIGAWAPTVFVHALIKAASYLGV